MKSATFPWVTVLCCGVALVIQLASDAETVLAEWAYQRSLLLDGGWSWISACAEMTNCSEFPLRLISAHLTHYSLRHLIFNLLAFASLGKVIERRIGHADFVVLCLLLAIFISAALLLFVPEMETYAGMSGINYGLLMFLGIQQLSSATIAVRSYGISALVVIVGVVLWQQSSAGSSMFMGDIAGVQVAWQAHLAGLSAAALFAAQRYDRFRLPGASSQHDAEGMALRQR